MNDQNVGEAEDYMLLFKNPPGPNQCKSIGRFGRHGGEHKISINTVFVIFLSIHLWCNYGRLPTMHHYRTIRHYTINYRSIKDLPKTKK